jgi:hypothetical protein
MYLITLAQACAIVDDSVWANPTVVTNNNIALDVGKRLNSYVLANLGIGVNVSQITNHNISVNIVCVRTVISSWQSAL